MTPWLQSPLRWCASASALLAGVLVIEWAVHRVGREPGAGADADPVQDVLLACVVVLLCSAATAARRSRRGTEPPG